MISALSNSVSRLIPDKKADPILVNYLVPLLYLSIGITFISIGVHSYDIFLECDNVSIASSKKWKTKAGYEARHLHGFLTGTILLPIGYVSLLIFIVQSYRATMNQYFKLFLYYALLGITLACTNESYLIAQEILDCGIYCVGKASTAPTKMKNAEAFIGMTYLLFCLCYLVLVAFVISAIHIKQIYPVNWGARSESNILSRIRGLLQPFREPFARNTFSIGSVFLVIFPILFFSCMILPKTWKSFTIAKIRAAEIADLDKKRGIGWAIHYNDYLIMKLYPDILFFYGTIYLVLCGAFISWLFPSIKKYMHRRLPFYPSLCVGEAVLLVVGLGLISGEWGYLHHYSIIKSKSTKSDAENAAVAIGEVSCIIMGLLTFPITRNSIWTILYGVSWDSLVKFHELLGYLFFATGIAHCFLWWKVYAEMNAFPHDILGYPTKVHSNSPTTPLMSIIFIFANALILIPSLFPVIRRKFHELFYWGHHFFVVLFLTVLWHAPKSWYLVTGGLILWVIDHGLRLFKCLGTEVKVAKLQVNSSNSLVTLSYQTRSAYGPEVNLRHGHGEYCFINIPSISSLEWHPFTIASHPNDLEVSHCIRNRGHQQWTGKLAEIGNAVQGEAPEDLVVIIDGPYGVPMSFEGYSHIVVVAGGIGITPFASILLDNCYETEGTHNKHIRLIWIVKETADLEPFQKLLNAISASPCIKADVCITQDVGEFSKEISFGFDVETKSDPINKCIGRPDLQAEVKNAEQFGSSAMLVVCGPPSLADSCAKLCTKIHFRRESFEY